MTVSARTVILSGLGALIVGGLLYVSLRTEPVAVDLHSVTSGILEVTIDADGKTQIRDIYEVSAPITGTALRSPVKVGDPVVGGETIVAVVEPVAPSLLDARTRLQAEAVLQEAEAALHVAETDLTRAQEDAAFAQTQYDRIKTLVERNVSSITQLEDAAQRLAIAKAGVEAAQARIDMANGTIERAEATLLTPDIAVSTPDSCCVQLKAPANGVVLSVAAISQRPVLAGAPLVTIGDPNELELVADLLSGDAVRLTPGASAYVERWGGNGRLEAHLERIDPIARTKVSALGIEEQRVDAIFSLVSPKEQREGLGEGFSVFLRIVEWRAENALQVPLSAIFKRGSDWAVYVNEDGAARERPVSLGRRNDQMAEVLSGLDVGDEVIMHPSDEITSGTSIIQRSEL